MSVVSGPEPAHETRVRRWVLLAFLLCYGACAPLWYATSRVNRETMPEIPDAQSERDAHVQHMLPLQLHVMFAREVAAAEWKEWASSASELLRQELAAKRTGSDDAGHRVQWTIESPRESGVAALTANVSLDALRSKPRDLDDALAQLPARSSAAASGSSSVSLPLWRLFVLISDSASDDVIWTMGRHRHAFISVSERRSAQQRRSIVEQAANMLHWMAESQACPVLPGAPVSASAAAAAAAASPSSSPTCSGSRSLSQRLSFTLLNDMGDDQSASAASPRDYSWNFAVMQRAYLQPFIDHVGSYVKLEVDSSVRHFAALTAEAKPVKIVVNGPAPELPQPAGMAASTQVASSANRTVWSLPSSALRNLIGSIGEWNAPSPLVSHSMELLAYIPPLEQRPLVIDFGKSGLPPAAAATARHTALVVSQYGGVLVVNNPGDCSSSSSSSAQHHGSCQLDSKAVKEIMQVFVEQIRQTLAMGTRADQPLCVLLGSPHTGVSLWELDLFASRVVRVNLADSLAMLQGLYALLDSVPHMPVDLDVQAMVQATIESRAEAQRLLREGHWEAAGRASQAAVRTASQAFFHPNMLPSLYFPDEHLYAVYLPFFLPITVPLVVAVIKVVGSWRKTKTA